MATAIPLAAPEHEMRQMLSILGLTVLPMVQCQVVKLQIWDKTYQTTTHVPEALHRLTESYLALGIDREAQVSAAVLGHNYPGSKWYQDSYGLLERKDLQPKSDEGSWMSRAFRRVGAS